MGGNFLLPTFGVTQDLAQTGENGPSIFPTAALGARVHAKLSDDLYMQAAAYDAVAGDPDRPHGTHITLDRNDGALLIAETGYVPQGPANEDAEFNKLALGAWTYTKGVDDLRDVDRRGTPVRRKNEGIYLLSSYRFYNEESSEKALGVVMRAGLANADVNQTRWSVQAGVVANGWIVSRPDSEIGIGYSYARNSGKYERLVKALGGLADAGEGIWEFYYHDELGYGISFQPDVQYIVNPGADPVVDNALVAGLRVGVSF